MQLSVPPFHFKYYTHAPNKLTLLQSINHTTSKCSLLKKNYYKLLIRIKLCELTASRNNSHNLGPHRQNLYMVLDEKN